MDDDEVPAQEGAEDEELNEIEQPNARVDELARQHGEMDIAKMPVRHNAHGRTGVRWRVVTQYMQILSFGVLIVKQVWPKDAGT